MRRTAIFISRLRYQLPQHERQNAAVLVVINLNRRINAAADGNIFNLPVLARNLQREVLLRLDVRVEADNVKGFSSVQFQCQCESTFLELQRQHAHADEVAAMNALKA